MMYTVRKKWKFMTMAKQESPHMTDCVETGGPPWPPPACGPE